MSLSSKIQHLIDFIEDDYKAEVLEFDVIDSLPKLRINTSCTNQEFDHEHIGNLSNFVVDQELKFDRSTWIVVGHFSNDVYQLPAIVQFHRKSLDQSTLQTKIKSTVLANAHKVGRNYAEYTANIPSMDSLNLSMIYPWSKTINCLKKMQTPKETQKEKQEQRDNKEKETEKEDEKKSETDKEKEKEKENESKLQNDEQPICEITKCVERDIKVFRKHYFKRIEQEFYLIRETPKMYNAITKKYIDSIPDSDNQWIDDILTGKKEKERVIYQDDNFVSVIDSKWRSHINCQENTDKSLWKTKMNKNNIEKNLYILSVIKNKKIQSLRDINDTHVKMLETVLNGTKNAIKNIYGFDDSRLRVFVHYWPQYFHFHIHFTTLSIHFGCNIEKAHLLEDIIDNVKMNANYYQQCGITAFIGKRSKLHQLFLDSQQDSI